MVPYKPSEKLKLFPLLGMFFLIHLIAIVGLILFPPGWHLFVLMAVIYLIQGLGITLTYHRCFAHRAFEFRSKWLERFSTTIGSLALQRGPIWWCSIHRIHHRYSDTPMDPHDCGVGFWYAHVLWFGYLDPRWEWSYKLERYQESVSDISSDPYYRWLDRYFYAPMLLLWMMLYLIGGWPWVIWGGFISTIVHWHFTWAVNSLAHTFGYRTFRTEDTATNNWLLAPFASGEGWHNNHHSFPSSPKHGFFKWWEFDSTYLVILFLEKIGCIRNLRYPSEKHIEMMKKQAAPAGY